MKKETSLSIKKLGPDRFEIKDHGYFGLAKRQGDEWLVSPNMEHKKELVLKMIRESLTNEA